MLCLADAQPPHLLWASSVMPVNGEYFAYLWFRSGMKDHWIAHSNSYCGDSGKLCTSAVAPSQISGAGHELWGVGLDDILYYMPGVYSRSWVKTDYRGSKVSAATGIVCSLYSSTAWCWSGYGADGTMLDLPDGLTDGVKDISVASTASIWVLFIDGYVYGKEGISGGWWDVDSRPWAEKGLIPSQIAASETLVCVLAFDTDLVGYVFCCFPAGASCVWKEKVTPDSLNIYLAAFAHQEYLKSISVADNTLYLSLVYKYQGAFLDGPTYSAEISNDDTVFTTEDMTKVVSDGSAFTASEGIHAHRVSSCALCVDSLLLSAQAVCVLRLWTGSVIRALHM